MKIKLKNERLVVRFWIQRNRKDKKLRLIKISSKLKIKKLSKDDEAEEGELSSEDGEINSPEPMDYSTTQVKPFFNSKNSFIELFIGYFRC